MASVAATDENSTSWKLNDASAVVFVCTRQQQGRPAVQYSFHVTAGMQTVMLPPNVATFIFSEEQEQEEGRQVQKQVHKWSICLSACTTHSLVALTWSF
eukprot:6211749-Pleurochrysis_carterae.AAC.3